MSKQRKYQPVHSHVFEGMEDAVTAQAMAAAEMTAEKLSEKMLEPIGDVSGKSGRMERESPLFFGSIHPTLF
jgi:hypothetical protein